MRKGMAATSVLMLLVITFLISSVEGAEDNTDPYLYFLGEDMFKPMEVEFNKTVRFNFSVEDVDHDELSIHIEIYTMSLVNSGEVDRLIFEGPEDGVNWSVEYLIYRTYYGMSFMLDHGMPRGAGMHTIYPVCQCQEHSVYYSEKERYSQLSGKIDYPSIFENEDENITERSLLFIIRVSDGRGGSNFISKVVNVRRSHLDIPTIIQETPEVESGIYIGPDPNVISEGPSELPSSSPSNDGSDEVDFPWGIGLILLGASIFLITLGVSMNREDRMKK